MGCYSSGGSNYDTLVDGLTQSQTTLINTSKTYSTADKSYLLELATGVTIEKCINICKQLSFLYAGLEWG